MAEPKSPSKPAARSDKAAVDAKAVGVDPKAVYVGGESLADRLVPHIKKILAGLGVIAVILAVYFLYDWWQHRKAEKATTVLMGALDEHRLEVEEPDDEPITAPDEDDPPPPRTFATEQERAEAVLAKLSSSGEVRGSAAMLEARMLVTAGRLDDAEKIYQRGASAAGLDGVLAREGLAYIAETRALAVEGDARKAGLELALAAYQKTQEAEDGPRRDYALYNEGRLLALLGKKDEARVLLEKALAMATPDLETTIEVRLSQLDATDLPQMPLAGIKPPSEEPPPIEEEETPPPTDGETPPPATPDAGG